MSSFIGLLQGQQTQTLFMNALGGRLLYVCCLLMINFGPSFRATSSVFYQCSFEQKSRTKCVHHIVQQEKKKTAIGVVQYNSSSVTHTADQEEIFERIQLKNSSEYAKRFPVLICFLCYLPSFIVFRSTRASFTYILSKRSLEFHSLEFYFPSGHWSD